MESKTEVCAQPMLERNFGSTANAHLRSELQGLAGLPRVSVVSPCYNEEGAIAELYRRVSAACRSVAEDDYEIILVDDGSQDATRDAITRLVEEDNHVTGVILSRNHGHQLALSAGLEVSSGDRVFILDADLQDPPELLAEMMRLMDSGYDVVYGRRRQRQGETAFKKMSAALFYRFLKSMTEVDIPIDTGDFRLMSRRSLQVLLNMPERHRFLRGMVGWIGFRQTALVYDRQERYAGTTKFTLRKMLNFAADAITAFSIIPLRVASYLSIFCGIGGIIALVYAITQWAYGHTVPGWTSVVTAVLFTGSAQLFVIGVMGEYLGRLYMESKNRPLFIIQEIVRKRPSPHSVRAPEDVR